MSNLIAKIIPLSTGLNLASPKLLAEPGSLLDCLNYELTDISGYKRIDGFQRYDGNVSFKDIPNAKVYSAPVSGTGTLGAGITNQAFEDSFGNIIGFIFSAVPIPETAADATITYMSFSGSSVVEGTMASTAWSFTSSPASHSDATITQTELRALESYLRGLVNALPYTPVGLHWFEDTLYAIVPLIMVPYETSEVNQTVTYTLNTTIESTSGGMIFPAVAVLMGKVVTQEASVSTTEQGYFIIQSNAGNWEASTVDTETLSTAVSVASGDIYHQPGNLEGMESSACVFYKAIRPPTYTEVFKFYEQPGWTRVGIQNTFTLTVTLSTITPEFNSLRKNNTEVQSRYYFTNGSGVLRATVVDYFIVSGSFAAGDAVIRLQVGDLTLQSGSPGTDITTAFDMTTDSGGSTVIADVTARMAYNYLPGFPELNAAASRYQFKTANFYASDDDTQIYGVSGAGRAFSFDGEFLSFIYTQNSSSLDQPRHLENHQLHLALGFRQGSVQLSVAGQPTNFSGLEGASDVGVGDKVTGLMEVSGTTLAVFCEQSVWAIVGTSVDNFQTQTIAPNTGCLEYSLANCGFPVYADSRGISTLQTSEKYGDFVGQRLSSPVSPWLLPRCKTGLISLNNSSGIACAVPIRTKNQYRLFFNDGEILTMTFMYGEQDSSVGFTFQRYYLEQEDITDELNRLVPIATTSEMDRYGVERTYAAHYNEDSAVQTNHVFALDSGNSFDGNYIPHYFVTNWYFADNPFQFQTLQGVRLYGLSKGMAGLNIQSAGVQNDIYFGGTSLSTTTTPINLPRTTAGIGYEFRDSTTRASIAARGLATQLKFSGSNTNLSLIEPSHVAQVLVTYSAPDGAFDL